MGARAPSWPWPVQAAVERLETGGPGWCWCYAAYDYTSMGQTVRYSGYGPDRLGTSKDHTGRAPQHRILEGLYQGTHRSQLRAGPSRTWTTNLNLLRHRNYGIGRPSRGNFLPAHHWDGSPGKVIRHSTRRATRASGFGGAGPSSGSVRWRAQKRTTAGGPSGATDT
jgi:hypothetical protein